VKQFIRISSAFFLAIVLSYPALAQAGDGRSSQRKSKAASSAAKKPAVPRPKPEATPKPADPAAEKERFDAAIAAVTPTEKAELLVKFLSDYPESENKTRAQESLAGARAAMADERLTAGEMQAAVKLFRLAIDEAPKPYSDRLYNSVISTIPANLYWRGMKAEGLEMARLIETNAAANANQLLLLAAFYLGTESGDSAKRIAEAAVKLDEMNSVAHQTLASAHRLNFDLEGAAASFAKAVELDPESTTSKRSLADTKRALGNAAEAENLYREILARNEKDNQARTGLVLSLFDLGKRDEAEAEMAKTLEEAPGNVVLLAGAAYWYAANKDGNKAVEYARRAIEKEPRFVWSHIALGRGLMLQNKPVDAEQALIAARKYGNFPTLQYEIASARYAAGFFREAVEELKRSFVIEGGSVKTKLGGRVEKLADTFTEAIAAERRASIFSPAAADSADGAARLKALLELDQQLAAETKNEEEIAAVAGRFADGSDNMSIHRKLYAADLLLQKGVASEKAMELSRSVVAGLDRSLEVANPGAAVMASELYEARTVSFARDDFLLIPDVPKQTLNSLMRGRVEELTGLALMRQGKPDEATTRFRRALTVLPKDSAWWRSATWNLGTSLAAEGKDQEALDAMISSYKIDKPNLSRYIAIESLWQKVKGNRDGLEEKIGPNPLPTFTTVATESKPPAAEPVPTPAVAAEPDAKKADTVMEAPAENKVPRSLPIDMAATKHQTESNTAQSVAEPKAAAITSPSPELAPTPAVKVEEAKTTDVPPAEPAKPEQIEAKPAGNLEEAKAEVHPSPSPEVSPSPDQKEPAAKTEEKMPQTDEPEKKPISRTSDAPAESPRPEEAKPIEEKPKEPESNKESEIKVVTLPDNLTRDEMPTEEPAKPSPAKAAKSPQQSPPGSGMSSDAKSLFQPIIISVPKTKEATRQTAETIKESPSPEPEMKDEPKPTRKAAEVVISDGLARPRVVEGRPVTQEGELCKIGTSQDNFSLIRNGGSAAVLVSIDLGRNVNSIQAASSSPQDVEVRPEPDVVEIASRALYVIKSISNKTGMYQVAFNAPCGKREVIVRVR